jgi:predicted ATPase with chaperone activity
MSQHCAEGAIPGDALRKHLIAGEVSLDGSLKPVRGVLSQGLLARRLGLAGIMVPAANSRCHHARIGILSIVPVLAVMLVTLRTNPLERAIPYETGHYWEETLSP